MTAPRSSRRSQTYELPLPLSCLEQAEVCREQARDAARLKRFRAALGLFSTAAALCRRAHDSTDTDEATRRLADERLSQIDIETSTYSELVKSQTRPLS